MKHLAAPLLVLLALGCRQLPRPLNYRRLEVYSESGQRLEFGFILRMTCASPWDADFHRTPWRYEVDLDTAAYCICGARGYVFKTSPEEGRFRIALHSRDEVLIDTFANAPHDTVMVLISTDVIWPLKR